MQSFKKSGQYYHSDIVIMLFLKMLFWGLGHNYRVDYLPNMIGILGLIPSAQKQTDKKDFVAQNCSTVISGMLFKFWLPTSAALLITLSSQISKGTFQTTARMLMSSSKYLLTARWLNCWRVEITQSRFPNVSLIQGHVSRSTKQFLRPLSQDPSHGCGMAMAGRGRSL